MDFPLSLTLVLMMTDEARRSAPAATAAVDEEAASSSDAAPRSGVFRTAGELQRSLGVAAQRVA